MRKSSIKNNKSSNKRRINLFTVFSILFVSYFVYTVFDQQIQINKYNSQIDMFTNEIEAKELETQYYKSQKENINSVEYIEDVARENLGYVKPYEKIFIDTNK